MPNPKTIAYQEMIQSFSLLWGLAPEGTPKYRKGKDVSDFITSSYLHQLEEEVKRLNEDKCVPLIEGRELSDEEHGYNSALDSEISLCESAIKEIKALQEHRCCDGECNHDDCCGKVKENCRYKCKCHE